MKTPKEIREWMDRTTYESRKDYEPLMLEIMCNIAISLEKIATHYGIELERQGYEREEEDG